MFKGSITALVTPFRDGAVDEKAFETLIDWQIREGTNGLVPCGSTGEAVTLTPDERRRLIEICVSVASGRVPVIAGCGSNVTAEAVAHVQHAKAAGADGALIVAPYYNKPGAEGVYRHFKACAEAADLPVIVYNVPGRTVIDINIDAVARLAEIPNVVGIKDASGDLARVPVMHYVLPDFIQLSGEDMTAVGFNAMGGVGCISVVSNVAPKLCAEMQAACASGDYAKALTIQDRLVPLMHALFVETNPAPAKFALSLLGLCENELRLPLTPVSEQTAAVVASGIVHAGIMPPVPGN